jgi:glucosylceramidase
MTGPFGCGGLVTIDSETGQVTHSGQYWAFMHYSKVIQRSARVIASEGEITGVSHVAFENPDNTYVLALNNKGSKQVVPVQLGTQALDVPLEENSVTTIAW